MRLEALLQCLEAEQKKLAEEALAHPQPGEFGYGKAVGMYAGLEHAKRVLLDLVSERDRKNYDL